MAKLGKLHMGQEREMCSGQIHKSTLAKRNMQWANTVWHVAARAHCISSVHNLHNVHMCTWPSRTYGNILQTSHHHHHLQLIPKNQLVSFEPEY